jgi:hypothetical protein
MMRTRGGDEAGVVAIVKDADAGLQVGNGGVILGRAGAGVLEVEAVGAAHDALVLFDKSKGG